MKHCTKGECFCPIDCQRHVLKNLRTGEPAPSNERGQEFKVIGTNNGEKHRGGLSATLQAGKH
jgi:hypothetical protein